MPTARGELSDWVSTVLGGAPPGRSPQSTSDCPVWMDEDLQLALWCCYELHYRGFDGVPPELEWSPVLLAFRAGLEERWLDGLRELPGLGALPEPDAPERLPWVLRDLVGGAGGPNLSGFLARRADRNQFAEFLAHRSVYQLKEADPHSFGIPRLDGPVKAALVEIQADEYGGGRAARMHAELFRVPMRWLGLEDSYGYYVPRVPAVTLALSNLMSYFALHRRWIGALLGHLAALEMTSTTPNRRYSNGARRLGATPWQRRYFDEHVAADAVHEQLAAHDLCGGFAATHPQAAGDVLFGAACCLALDAEFAEYLLAHWEAGRSSLHGAPADSLPA